MIKVAILGSSGYSGTEVIRILQNHKGVKINFLGANSMCGKRLSQTMGNFYRVNDALMHGLRDSKAQDSQKPSYPQSKQDIEEIKDFKTSQDSKTLLDLACENDCIITATPHEFLAHILTKEILKECVVIDLSADFRLKNPQKYIEYYNFTHKNLEILACSVYGLCEFYADSIKRANLIANPGCYPTCSIFSIAPFLRIIDTDSIIIDAKSGVSGAGRGAKVDNLFCEVNENIKAYGLINHRHTAEIEQSLNEIYRGEIYTRDISKDTFQNISMESGLKNLQDFKDRDSKDRDSKNRNFEIQDPNPTKKDLTITFTPHLVPMNRGILITAYATLLPVYKNITQNDLDSMLGEFYADKHFVRVLKSGIPPQTRWVNGSNFSDISVRLDPRNGRIIMMGALDNLIKGAAGQAVQNLNLRFGFDEGEALWLIAGGV